MIACFLVGLNGSRQSRQGRGRILRAISSPRLVFSGILQIVLILSAVFANGQTRPRPAQIRNWSQVAPPGIARAGTQLRIEQLAMDPVWVTSWTETIKSGYDHFRVAVVTDQANPILIVCLRRDDDPLGPGCTSGAFWFAVRRE